MSMVLHLQKVPPRNGLLWIRHGFKVVQRSPLAMLGLTSVVMMAMLLFSSIPPLLPLALMAPPLASLGFMLATHLVLQNQTPTVTLFGAPLRLTPERRKAQLLLCLGHGVALFAALMLFAALIGDTPEALRKMAQQPNPDREAIAQFVLASPLPSAFALFCACYALVSAVFWHAPALVHWGGQGPLQALFSSTLAIWRNKAAFAVNALGWFGLLLATMFVGSLIAGVLQLSPIGASMVMTPLMLVGTTAFQASLYFTFVDCFMFGAPRDVLTDKR